MMLHLRPLPRLRITAMIALILMSVARVFSYLTATSPDNPTRLAFIGPFIPDGWHAGPWALVALLALASLIRSRVEPIAVGAFVGMNMLWGASMLASTFVLHVDRAWVSAISYLGIAVLTGILFGMTDPADANRMGRNNSRSDEGSEG